jgi:glycine hydroxymethyltransferase
MNVLEKNDPEIFQLIKSEESYQKSTIRLIASENYTSKAVLEACGTVFQNKYSEGYPGHATTRDR